MNLTPAKIEVVDRSIGSGWPCFIIAEAGINHNGDIDMAMRLVDVASQAGADAIKFQTFRAQRLVSPDADLAEYQKKAGEVGSQFEMLRRLELSAEEHVQLQTYCRECNIIFLSSPFAKDDARFLADLGVPAFKLGSGELTNLPLLEFVANLGRPIFLSTGMSYLSEVDIAIQSLKKAGAEDVVLLHCVSQYPAYPEDANLRAMQTLEAAFHMPVGYSDHTLGIEVSLAAVARGACVLEKHFTLDRNLRGPDHQASLEPSQLCELVRAVRVVESALGHGRKEPAAAEAGVALVARKSLVATRDLPAGHRLEASDLDTMRPGGGISPLYSCEIIGRRLIGAIRQGEQFRWGMWE